MYGNARLSWSHLLSLPTASRTKEISEGTTLAWAQLFRPAGHAGQRSFARRNFGRGSRTHPKNTIHTVLHTISYGGSIYLLVVPPLWGSVSQINTDPADRPDGWRSRTRRRARRGRYRTEGFSCVCRDIVGGHPCFAEGDNPPRTHVSQGRTKFL